MSLEKKYIPLNELIRLTDKKALVTGAAMGIGFAIAYRLAEAGATVAIIDLNEEKGQKAAEDLVNCGYRAFFLRCDVSREEEVKNTIDAAIVRMGGLDILVNNAGIFPFTPLLQLTASDIEKVLAVNLKGLLYFTREASRWMIEQKRSGSIINLASVDSLHPSHKGLSVYDASKGAVLTLTKSLAKELGPNGIRVNAIAPGGILTEGAIAQSRGSGETSRTGLKEFMSRIALGRMGVADDIGRVALFLAADLSGYMTGSLVVVDGGYLLS
jgi:NAD(P)-dependent dehydrogenase (short-subunit alcohol dehydrogenase family)